MVHRELTLVGDETPEKAPHVAALSSSTCPRVKLFADIRATPFDVPQNELTRGGRHSILLCAER